jgi:hypothetical protein
MTNLPYTPSPLAQEEYATRVALTAALIPLLRRWAELNYWHDTPDSFTAAIVPDTDPNTRGEALVLRFTIGECGDNSITVEECTPQWRGYSDSASEYSAVTLRAHGKSGHEQFGLTGALAVLLSQLLEGTS